MVATCQLRTGNGEDIVDRCENAWSEGRPVKLDFPDEMRMRQQVSVVALRLDEVDAGQVLQIWVSLPYETVMEIEDDDIDDYDDDYDDDDDDNLLFP